jgi:hypothetical protein
MTEKEIILGCIKEDEKAQRELFDLYQDKMFFVCLENCKNEKIAREALVEGFIKIYDNIKKFKGGSFEFWMVEIMKKESEKQNSKFSWNPLDWQGRRKDQVEYSEIITSVAVSILIITLASMLICNLLRF